MSRGRKFHKKKVVTENVADDRTASFLTKTRKWDSDKTGDKGLWCKSCKRRIGWRELEIAHEYDKKIKSVFRVWVCSRCGNMVQEDDLTDMGLAQELNREVGVREVK